MSGNIIRLITACGAVREIVHASGGAGTITVPIFSTKTKRYKKRVFELFVAGAWDGGRLWEYREVVP